MVITVIIIVYTLILYTHTALLAHTLHTYIHCIIYRPIICLHPTHFAYPIDTHIYITLYSHYQHITHSLVAPFLFFHELPSYLDRYRQQLSYIPARARRWSWHHSMSKMRLSVGAPPNTQRLP